MDNEETISPIFRKLSGEIDRRLGAVGAAARNDRHALFGIINTELADIQVLLLRHGRSFAGGTADNDSVSAVLDLKIDQFGKGVVIDG